MAKKDLISELVKELSKEGQRIVANQLNNVGYTHRTYNLNDSYGFGVYVDGKLVLSVCFRSVYRSQNGELHERPDERSMYPVPVLEYHTSGTQTHH